MTETEGQRAFRRALLNALSGLCVCGRRRNRQGKVCCRMCADYGTHSHLCRRRNGGS